MLYLKMNVPTHILLLCLLCMVSAFSPNEGIRDLMIPANSTSVEWDQMYYIQNNSWLQFSVPDDYLHLDEILCINQTLNSDSDYSKVVGCFAPLEILPEETKEQYQFVTRLFSAKINFSIFDMVKYTLWNETHGILTETVLKLLDCNASRWNIVCQNKVQTTAICPLHYADTKEVIIATSKIQISNAWVTNGKAHRHVYDEADGKIVIGVHDYSMTLTIKPSCDLGGDYGLTSTAKNSRTDFKNISLEIKDDVFLKLYQDKNKTKLSCGVVSGGTIMSMTWLKNDNTFHTSDQRNIGFGELLLNATNTADGDIFVCKVQTRCGFFTSDPVIWSIKDQTDQHQCATSVCDCGPGDNTVLPMKPTSNGYTEYYLYDPGKTGDHMAVGVAILCVFLFISFIIIVFLIILLKKKHSHSIKKATVV